MSLMRRLSRSASPISLTAAAAKSRGVGQQKPQQLQTIATPDQSVICELSGIVLVVGNTHRLTNCRRRPMSARQGR